MKILTIGGDLRMHFAAMHLAEQGQAVRLCGTCPLENPFPTADDYRWADALLLPLPLTRGETVTSPLPDAPALSHVASFSREGLWVFGGSIPHGFRECMEGGGAQVWDYYTDQTLTQENAALTAEGAAWEWMKQSDGGISGKRCAVVGFGRIARHLCRLLLPWQVRVTVYARKESDQAEARSCGYESFPLSPQTVFAEADALFNTVPARIFSEASFALCAKTLVFDLADSIKAAPGAASLQNLRGVPGKYAPRAAGEAIARAVLRSLSSVSASCGEEGV